MSTAATLWLLLAISLTASCLWVLCAVCRAWHNAEQQLEYRTADWSAIDCDTRKLQAQVPDAPSPTVTPRKAACTGNCNQGRHCTCRPARSTQLEQA